MRRTAMTLAPLALLAGIPVAAPATGVPAADVPSGCTENATTKVVSCSVASGERMIQVPSFVRSVHVVVRGAAGGAGTEKGGAGGVVTADVAVNDGYFLYVGAGKAGAKGGSATAGGTQSGHAGGGGGAAGASDAGSGGGASAVVIQNNQTLATVATIIGGGGGGGAGTSGGAGGGAGATMFNGTPGGGDSGGKGATTGAVGAGGAGSPAGAGGSGATGGTGGGGGGGGGGKFGGGGGGKGAATGGGGGGSSYAGGGRITASKFGGATNTGSGSAVVSWKVPCSETAKVTIAGARTTEGNSGTKALKVPVKVTPALACSPLTVRAKVAPGTATANTDYSAGPYMTASIAPGKTTGYIVLTVKGDKKAESDETIKLTLTDVSVSSVTGTERVSIGTPKSAAATIVDDD